MLAERSRVDNIKSGIGRPLAISDAVRALLRVRGSNRLMAHRCMARSRVTTNIFFRLGLAYETVSLSGCFGSSELTHTALVPLTTECNYEPNGDSSISLRRWPLRYPRPASLCARLPTFSNGQSARVCVCVCVGRGASLLGDSVRGFTISSTSSQTDGATELRTVSRKAPG